MLLEARSASAARYTERVLLITERGRAAQLAAQVGVGPVAQREPLPLGDPGATVHVVVPPPLLPVVTIVADHTFVMLLNVIELV